jgi:hypothetical protein
MMTGGAGVVIWAATGTTHASSPTNSVHESPAATRYLWAGLAEVAAQGN